MLNLKQIFTLIAVTFAFRNVLSLIGRHWRFVNREKANCKIALATTLDVIILEMRAGTSFESALLEISDSVLTMDQEISTEFEGILRMCRENPTQAFTVLNCFREAHRLRARLIQKQSTIALQPKLQAVVSLCLYFSVFLAQIALNDSFLTFLKSVSGRGVLVLSMGLLLSGVFLVFKLSVPRNLTA